MSFRWVFSKSICCSYRAAANIRVKFRFRFCFVCMDLALGCIYTKWKWKQKQHYFKVGMKNISKTKSFSLDVNGLLERYLVNASKRISKLQWDVKVFSLTPQCFCHEIGLNLGLCFRAKKLENHVSRRIVFLGHPAGTSVILA